MGDGLRLDGRVALVSGAGQGIGAAVAAGFVARGAAVVASDLAPASDLPAALAWLATEPRACYCQVDVTDPLACQRAVELARERFGGLHVVIANAGIYPQVAFPEMTAEQWHAVLAVNLHGAFNLVQAATPVMIEQGYGKVICTSSINVAIVQAQRAHYIASKAGLIGFCRGLARDLGGHGIRANCILPGAVLTEGELRDFPDQPAVLELVNQFQCLPGRLLPEQVEPAFAFFASAASDAITGQSLAVDQGWAFL